MRDIEHGAATFPAHHSKAALMRFGPLSTTALVGSVFLCLLAALTSIYLAMVLPSFDRLFASGRAAGAAPVTSPARLAAAVPRIAPPPRPLPVEAALPPAEMRYAPAPVAAPARPGMAGEELTPVVASRDPRPVARPEALVARVAQARASEPGADGTAPRAAPATDPAMTALVALAAPVSPRPAARPARLVAAVSSTPVPANTRPAADARPAAQPASLTRPEAPVSRSGNFSGTCSARLARAIPRRPASAKGGSAFVATLANAAGGERDAAILREALSGNIPSFLRRLVPVKLAGTLADGRQAEITICVAPDYLALGSNRDYVRVPLGLHAAAQVADAFNMMLPTTRMVDAIYRQAAVHLSPKPMPAGGQMVTTAYFLRHNQTVQGQLASARAPLGALVAGQKKDLVLTNRLASSPGRVAIYGWHRGNGSPIQPLTTIHGAAYADYSHGIRLVSRTAYLNGRPVDLRTLLQDRRYARLLSTEGPVGASAIRIASR